MSCAADLEIFTAASEQAASNRRVRRHAAAQATGATPAYPDCVRVCASDFSLPRHLRFFFFFLANSCQSVDVLMTCRQMSLSLTFLKTV